LIVNHRSLYLHHAKEAIMATVIAFPNQQGRAREAVEAQGPATIIMFTGVRVERLDVETPARPTTRRMISKTSEVTLEDLEA
jgi:hypothetical protein